MDTRPHLAVTDAYAEAWRLKGQILAVHLAALVLFAALLSPVFAVVLSVALMFSGKPALTDQDIALFVLSPDGALVATAIAALYVAVQTVGFAAKMAVLSSERAGHNAGPWPALRLVAGQGPRLIRFALALVLRLAVIVLPVLAIAGIAAFVLLADYDINFYLSERPPEFLVMLGIGGLLGLGLAGLLIPRLLGWAVALPMVLFGTAEPGASFAASKTAMDGRRWSLLRRLAIWAAIAVGLAVAVGIGTGLAASAAARVAGEDVDRLARLLLMVLAVYAVASTLVGALSSGALAHLLLDEADWPAPFARPTAAPRIERRTAWVLGGLALGAFVLLVGGGIGAPGVAAPGEIAIIAHRGGAAERPENTMAAMELGIEQGADWLEIDVQENAEGAVIVVHDSDFMKLSGVPTKVWDVTAAELETIDVGAWFAPDFAGQRVPLLADVLEAARDRSKVLIELKYYGHDTALEERVADAVDEAGMGDRVAAMSLSPEGAARMKALRPDWQVGLLAASALGRLARVEADFLAVRAAIATPRLLREAEAAGKPVYVWTINDAPGMARMAGLGVDGLITDRPGLAREVLEELATLSAPERFALAVADRFGLAQETVIARDRSP